ncbi:MAG: VATC domain-containing protein [Burkholderia sp.]|jgi:uncharacterized protein
MGRILFFIALFGAIFVAWTISRKRNSLDNEERRELERLRAKERRSKGKDKLPAGEPMIRCENCGIYFPKKDAVWSGEHAYCSKRCRSAAEKGE